MFRTACLVAAVALCAATAPPRIELELDGQFSNMIHDGSLSPTKFGKKGFTDRIPHINGAGQTHRKDASRMDFVEKCEADATGSKYNPKDCKLPKAKVYDYLDTQVNGKSNIAVDAKYCQVDRDRTPVTCKAQPVPKNVGDLSKVTYGKGQQAHKIRGSYLFTHDAEDAAGNDAQQVVFVLIVNDEIAPVISTNQLKTQLEVGADKKPLTQMGYRTMTCTDAQKLDAAGLTATAAKPVKGSPSNKITMTATTDSKTPAFATCTKSTANCKNSWDKVLRKNVGEKITIDITCTDSAGFYGRGGANNVANAKMVGTITDKTAPTIYPKDIEHTEVQYKLNHKNDQGTYTVNGNKDGTHKSEKHQDNAKSFVPIAIDETLECDASVQEDTPLPWVTLSRNHLTDAKDTTGKNVKPLGHYFAQTVCRDDKFGAIKNAPDFTTDVTCQVHGGKNWQSCDDLSAYANKILTSSSACDGGKKCLRTTKRLFGEKCTDGSSNVQQNKRNVIVKDTTPPTVDMKFKDWQAEWNTDAGRVGKPMAGKAHVRGGDGHTVHENHAIRVFKISADASHKGTFADACATGSKTTSGFNAARCENFIHDDTGARGEFYCKNIGKGWAKNRCTIATTEIGGMKLSDAAEMSFTDQCDNNDLFANPNFVEMSWKQVDSSGKVIACPAGASCNLDKNAKNVGIYHLQYEVRDKAGNKNAITFPIQMTDDEAPVIHMEGCNSDRCGEDMKECNCAVRLQASNTVEYTDYGAQCHDYVDGVLSHAVEVSGQVVNMRVPGTYIIQYDCADLSGNAAVSVTREVFVEDTLKPTLTLETDKSQGPDILFVEAGFPSSPPSPSRP